MLASHVVLSGNIQFVFLSASAGNLDPVTGKEPEVTDNYVSCLQLLISVARLLFCVVIKPAGPAESREGKQTYLIRQFRLVMLAGLGIGPVIDQNPRPSSDRFRASLESAPQDQSGFFDHAAAKLRLVHELAE